MIGGATSLETAMAELAHASWQAAVLGLLVLLVSAVLRGWLEPRWRFCLWLVVLARLALPATPPAPWSVFRVVTPPVPMRDPDRPTGTPDERPAPTGDRPDPVGPTVPTVEPVVEIEPRQVKPPKPVGKPLPSPEAGPARVVEPVEALAPTPEVANPPVGTVAPWLAVGWSAGVFVLLVRSIWLLTRLRRERRLWQDVADPAVRDVLRSCLDDLAMTRSIRLLAAPGRFGPATCGVLRPTVVIPQELLAELTPDELRLVLLHELVHVRRWDVLVDRVAAFLVAVHWFNPVAWLVLACLRRDRELACDAAVLRRVGTCDRGRYGHTLLNIAKRMVAPVRVPGAVGVFVNDQSLVRRIRMIAHYRTPGRAGKLLGGLLLLVLTAVGLTDAAVGLSPAAGPTNDPPSSPGAPTMNGESAKTITLSGVCEDEGGKPLAGVRVALYREDPLTSKVTQLQAVETGTDGRFEFRDLPPLPPVEGRPDWAYAVAATKSGHGSRVQSVYGGIEKVSLKFGLWPAGPLKGRVTDPAGKPVAGAWVWGPGLLAGPLDGIGSARTDADGRYEIRDMTAWDAAKVKPRPVGNGAFMTVSECFFDVRHPDYGHERPKYRRVPDTIDVVLRPAGVVTGRVVDRVTGKPAAGVVVSTQGTNANQTPGFHQARTAADGTYRLPSLTAGAYNLWAEAPDRACAALDSLAVEAGKTLAAPDLALIEGGWLEGQLVDAVTGKPIDGTKDAHMWVGLYGSSRPKSGGACQASRVDGQGRFRLNVAPGVNYPYLAMGDLWSRTLRREYYEKGIEVKAGEVVTIEFRILPTKPVPDPEPAPVRLAVPVPAEREAAALIRRLGGWYKVDADSHVVEVNMVYHETADKRRYDNRQVDTDEALRAVGQFPRLKELYLANGQATDDALKVLSGLKGLEVLLIWDAKQVTDAGVGHLAGLTKLRKVHLSNGQLGDDSLAVFGWLPAIRELSLQGSTFSDDGLKHLAGLKQLRHLWLGMSRKPITDAGARHLAGLTALESLDLQRARLTDEGVAALKNLKELRTLFLEGDQGAITDASVEHLLGMTKLQRLGVHNSRLSEKGVQRLLGLSDLKALSLDTVALPPGRQEQWQKERPGLQLHLSEPRTK